MSCRTACGKTRPGREAAIEALPEPQRSKIRETHGAFTRAVASDTHLSVLQAATTHLRTRLSAPKVASIGFCLGGGLSGKLAVHDPELAGAVIFYGTSPSEEQVPHIQAPILGLYGSEDPRINGTIAAFAAAAERHGKHFEQHIYPGAQHAFFNDNRPSYNVAATRDAWVRVLGFLQQQLA